MKTERLQAEGINAQAGLARAAELLRAGRLVAFPTETVYGLGANALDESAVAKIFEAKQRPAWDPLIVHIDSPAMLDQVAEVPAGSYGTVLSELMAAFWPGALTLLLPRKPAIPDAVTAGRPLVGVRMPAHPVARQLIRQAGIPIAAPSANRFGHTSPTTAAHVLADLDGGIDAVLDAGNASIGVESTVLGPDPNSEAESRMLIYRPGGITLDMLEAVAGKGFFAPYQPPPGVAPQGLPSPGVGIRHYAPRARLVLVPIEEESPQPLKQSLVQAIAAAALSADGSAAQVGVMLPDGWNPAGAAHIFRWGPWSDAKVLARLLFLGLRLLDDRGVQIIVCPVPRPGGLGDALRDRLEKAARAA